MQQRAETSDLSGLRQRTEAAGRAGRVGEERGDRAGGRAGGGERPVQSDRLRVGDEQVVAAVRDERTGAEGREEWARVEERFGGEGGIGQVSCELDRAG